MKKNQFVLVAATVVAAIFIATGCNNEAPAKETTQKKKQLAPHRQRLPIPISVLRQSSIQN